MLVLILCVVVLLVGWVRTLKHVQDTGPGDRQWYLWNVIRVRDILDETGKLYLRRFHLLDFGACKLFLHNIAQADHDRELHNHPWRWAYSLILRGGYIEERPAYWRWVSLSEFRPHKEPVLRQHLRKAGDLNVLSGEDFHRISSVFTNTWTLFLVGPHAQDWGFMTAGGFIPWRKYLGAGEKK